MLLRHFSHLRHLRLREMSSDCKRIASDTAIAAKPTKPAILAGKTSSKCREKLESPGELKSYF